ncbi:hypothetical protein [Paenibacillus sp. yr247]|nr:hypothetical protein [Paenibacillus sp. yr247]
MVKLKDLKIEAENLTLESDAFIFNIVTPFSEIDFIQNCKTRRYADID